MTDDRFTTDEAAHMLGVSRRTLNYWMRDGKAKPTWTGPGASPQHSWSRRTLERIAERNGTELREVGS